MNEIVNKFILGRNKFMPKMHLRQHRFTYLIGKKKVGVKESRQKIWSVKKLVTCPRFSHFLPPNFLF